MLQAISLTKQYGDHTALRQLDLTVEKGEIFCLLGQNGAGKTTTAHELIELIPNSTLFDPEVIGGALERLLPPKRLAEVGDFQDLPIWRRLVIDTAAAMLAELGGTLVVPMTLLRQEYRDEIFGGLAAVAYRSGMSCSPRRKRSCGNT